jgi:hypothetical protein
MSSVGFTPTSSDQELDKLRGAYNSLKDVNRGIDGAKPLPAIIFAQEDPSE